MPSRRFSGQLKGLVDRYGICRSRCGRVKGLGFSVQASGIDLQRPDRTHKRSILHTRWLFLVVVGPCRGGGEIQTASLTLNFQL